MWVSAGMGVPVVRVQGDGRRQRGQVGVHDDDVVDLVFVFVLNFIYFLDFSEELTD